MSTRIFAHGLGTLRDDEELGAIEHPLLAERQALRFREEGQAFQHIGDLIDRAAAHLVGIVLEATFPVLVVVDLSVAEEAEESFDFIVGDSAAQSHTVNVADWY